MYRIDDRRNLSFVRPTMAAKPYPTGYSCSIFSARGRTRITASFNVIASATTAAAKAPTDKPATAQQVTPHLCKALAVATPQARRAG